MPATSKNIATALEMHGTDNSQESEVRSQKSQVSSRVRVRSRVGKEQVLIAMSACPATCRRVFEDSARPPETLTTRKIVAVGDLHGDFYRLTRILEEEDVLIPGTFAWNPRACHVDLVLIGDYVDWRGEPLEGDPERSVDGARRILELLQSLHKQAQELREYYEDFDGRLYALRGNHDDMMLDALRIFDFLAQDQLELLMKNAHQYITLRKTVMNLGLVGEQVETVMKFLNWYVQGGKTTIEGWGSVFRWKEVMDGDLGDFLRRDLLLGVIVNRRLYAHTVPDVPDFWRPLDVLQALPEALHSQLREAFLWSRKLWGFDYYTGSRTEPFTEKELDAMLLGLQVDGIVVGHTPVTSEMEPFNAYNGKVINIDLHGIPGSRALVESYPVDSACIRGMGGAGNGPPRSVLNVPHGRMQTDIPLSDIALDPRLNTE